MNRDCNQKLKVMHIISGDLWAGAETMAYNLLRRLREYNGLSLYVILLNEGRLAKELRDSGLKVCVIEESTNTFWQICRKIKPIVHDFHPDIGGRVGVQNKGFFHGIAGRPFPASKNLPLHFCHGRPPGGQLQYI